ncbi:MAG: hypothetical protein AAF995_07090 [Planctomycetota bacterium]
MSDAPPSASEAQHPLDNLVISDDRVCPGCEYALRGLREGGRCPECGRPIKPKRRRGRFEDNIALAPMAYLRQLRLGLLLMSLAILGLVAPFALQFFSSILALGLLLCALLGAPVLWAGGVAIVAKRRRTSEHTTPDAILDGDKLRYAIMLIHAMPVLAGLCLLLGTTVGGVLALLVPIGLVLLLGVLFGCVPLGVYLSALADWASDDRLSARLRGSAWFITVFGLLAVGLTLVSQTPAPFRGLAAITAVWMAVITAIALVVLLVGVLQLTSAVNWAINNQRYAEASRERAEEKRRARVERPSQTVDRSCGACGYDLEGLPLSGNCPECGQVFGEGEAVVFAPRPRPASRADVDDPIPLAGFDGDDAAGASPEPGSLAEDILGQRPAGNIRHVPRSITRDRPRHDERPPSVEPPAGDVGI